MQRVTVIGLGIIGTAWANNLHADGLTVRAWNRSAKALPFYEANLVQAIHDAEMILMVVADPPAVESILQTITPHLHSGQMVVQSSTISASWTKIFAEQVETTGALFLEAPFTGSKVAAEDRKTVFYLGGPEKTIDQAKPVLTRLASQLLHIGPIGSASSLKLAMNLNLALISEALNESLTLARAEGISDEIYFAALRANAGRSGFSDLKEPKLLAGDYSPQFSLKHMDKDLRLVLETADTLKLPLAQQLKSFYDNALKQGLGDKDFISVIQLLDRAKVKEK